MSTINTGNPKVFDIEAKVAPVIAALGTIPAVLIDVIAERNFDAMDYHRRTVLKGVMARFPGKRDAQRFMAARLFRYGRKRPDPKSLADVTGESFAVDERVVKLLEEGGSASASSLMLIPFKRQFGSVRGKYKGAWFNRDDFGPGKKFGISPTGLIFQRVAVGRKGERSKIVGIARRRRQQRALLGFYAAWDSIQSKVAAKYDADLETVLTEAGRNRIAERIEAGRAGRAAFSGALAANPKDFPGARAAAAAARARVRRTGL